MKKQKKINRNAIKIVAICSIVMMCLMLIPLSEAKKVVKTTVFISKNPPFRKYIIKEYDDGSRDILVYEPVEGGKYLYEKTIYLKGSP
jgi:hypothetical protein